MVTTKQNPIVDTKKGKEKGIKTFHCRKSSSHQGRDQEKEEGAKEL